MFDFYSILMLAWHSWSLAIKSFPEAKPLSNLKASVNVHIFSFSPQRRWNEKEGKKCRLPSRKKGSSYRKTYFPIFPLTCLKRIFFCFCLPLLVYRCSNSIFHGNCFHFFAFQGQRKWDFWNLVQCRGFCFKKEMSLSFIPSISMFFRCYYELY